LSIETEYLVLLHDYIYKAQHILLIAISFRPPSTKC